MNPTAHAYFDIINKQRDDDGHLLVYGKATDSSLDIDKQICDDTWLRSAMPSWFKWGNIREQHSAIAAGVATSYEAKDDGHYIEVKVVDTNSAKKVEQGVLKGFSVGIKNPRVTKDKDAPGGRIVGGEIVEVSLVDRPANSNCKLVLAKTAAAFDDLVATEELVEIDKGVSHVHKHTHDDSAHGHTHDDGLPPEPHEHGHVHAQDHADEAAEQAEIADTTDAVEADLEKGKVIVPDGVKDAGNYLCEVIFDCLEQLAAKESAEQALYGDDEAPGLAALRAAAAAMKAFEGTEEAEGEDGDKAALTAPTNYTSTSPGVISVTTTTDTTGTMTSTGRPFGDVLAALKAATPEQLVDLRAIFASEPTGEGQSPERRGAAEKALEATVAELGERLAKVEQMAAPGGPARTAGGKALSSGASDERLSRIRYLRAQADAFAGQEVAQGYLSMANELEAALSGGTQ